MTDDDLVAFLLERFDSNARLQGFMIGSVWPAFQERAKAERLAAGAARVVAHNKQVKAASELPREQRPSGWMLDSREITVGEALEVCRQGGVLMKIGAGTFHRMRVMVGPDGLDYCWAFENVTAQSS